MATLKKQALRSSRVQWKGDNIKDWRLPLRVGTLDRTGVANQLNRGFWPKQLSETRKISPTFQKPHILYLNSLSEVNKFLLNKKPVGTTPIVLVNLGASFGTAKTQDILAQQIRAATGASGIFFFRTGRALSEWYNDFVVNLSHNMGISEALEKIERTQSKGYMTGGLNQQTQLSTIVKDLIKKIENNRYPTNALINVKIDGNYRKMSLHDTGQYLRVNIKNLPYDQESGTANTINQAYKALSTAAKGKSMPVTVIRTKDTGYKAYTADVMAPSDLPKAKKKVSVKKAKKPAITSQPKHRAAKKKAAKKAIKKFAMKKGAGKKMAMKKRLKKGEAKPKNRFETIAKEAKGPTRHQPRYILAGFRKARANNTEKEFLLPDTQYQLCIKIGRKDIAFLKPTEEIDTSKEFEDQKVQEIEITLVVKISSMANQLKETILLPREGDSDMAVFKVKTPKRQGELVTEILAYHKSRLLQHAKLVMAVKQKDKKSDYKKPDFRIVASLKPNLANLASSSDFNASILIPNKADNKASLVGIIGNTPLSLPYNSGIKVLVDKIKKNIERVAATINKEPKLTDQANVDLLRVLANQGYLLYNNFLRKPNLQGHLQLVNNSGDYLPLDMAYTLGAPDAQSKLCEHAEEALLKGKCMECIKSREDEQSNICPFGFWSLSRVVERHQYQNGGSTQSGYELKVDSGSQQGALHLLKNALHGCTRKVDEAKKAMSDAVSDSLKKFCGAVKVVKDWKAWKSALSGDPDSLILIVHVENNPVTQVDAIEIGKALLDKTQFDGRYLPSQKKGKAPFVILIGCETSNIDAYMFDTVSQLFVNGAGIVVSNFTKIMGDQAGEIVMQLVELLKNEAEKEMRFGEIMLKLRQQLVARGRLVGLSLLAHGDTDWKIKT